MKQNSYLHPLKLILGFIAIVLLAALLGGCGSPVRFKCGITLPAKGGLSK